MAFVYWARVTEDESGTGFNVSFPDKPNVLTCGVTLKDALVHARDALNGVLEVEIEAGYPPVLPVHYGKPFVLDLDDPDLNTVESIACTLHIFDPSLYAVPVRADLIPRMRALL